MLFFSQKEVFTIVIAQNSTIGYKSLLHPPTSAYFTVIGSIYTSTTNIIEKHWPILDIMFWAFTIKFLFLLKETLK